VLFDQRCSDHPILITEIIVSSSSLMEFNGKPPRVRVMEHLGL
jgi:hypothetical protein